VDGLDIKGRWFVDPQGRRVILRGVNLGGDCKVPYPDGGTNHPSDFRDHREVSFIGRPFPLGEAREHFGRLKHWGFNCLRLLTTWEAVEHKGPGILDEAYLDYFAEISRLAGEFGLYVFIDFHQDVWSRMSGGDGAPGWTFEAAGLDFTKFHAADATHAMQYKYDYASGGRQEDRYPQMSWASNSHLPATAIMWTLFFAGRDMAPGLTIEGRNVQDYLQAHYAGAMRAVAERVKDQKHVLGFDTLNEPGAGYIGQKLTYRHVAPTAENPERPRPGIAMSPLDGILIARGVPRTVPFLAWDSETRAMRQTKEVTLNPNGVSIWLDGRECPFEQAGAYDATRQNPPNETFFTHREMRELQLERDYMRPFFAHVADTVRAVKPSWMIFAEVEPHRVFTGHGFPPDMPPRTVNASHWYDLATLGGKKFNPRELRNTPDIQAAEKAVADRFTSQLANIAKAADALGADGAPTLIGEFGIPFDLDEGAAYAAWAAGDRSIKPWQKHVLAQSLMYDAMDRLFLSSTQWNYTASNRNDAAVGDNWNQEDLSIYSRDQSTGGNDVNSGGRAIDGFSRPYARRIQGEPKRMAFDRVQKIFQLVFEADPTISAATEIVTPLAHFPHGARIHAPGCHIVSQANGIVLLAADSAGERTVMLSAK
jgi:Cellulase (glycosyl hydrolase family 5)/Glycoside hydrolase family 5 C-terminal domain